MIAFKEANLFTKVFWTEATERALKTLAQFFITLTAGTAFNVFTADWKTILGLSFGGTILSYATSILSVKVGKTGTPSLVAEEIEPEPAPEPPKSIRKKS